MYNQELARRVALGDAEARSEMVEYNLRLVQTCVKKFRGRGFTPEELTNAGVVGLIHAIETFDENEKIPFANYAARLIDQAIRKWLCKQSDRLRIPATTKRMLQKWRKLRDLLGSGDEAAKELGYTQTEYRRVRDADAADQIRRTDADTLYSPEHRASDAERVDFRDELQFVITHLNRLEPRERYVIGKLFGRKPMTMPQVGRELGVTPQAVNKIKNRAIARLRAILKVDADVE